MSESAGIDSFLERAMPKPYSVDFWTLPWQITAVRKELDQEYEAQVGLKTQLSKDQRMRPR
jgi:hypothetical protein